MRIESSIKGWFAVVAVSVSAVSCDMLDITQDNKLSVSNMWKTAEQVEGSTYGIYSELRSNFVQSQINVFYWGELRVGEYMWGPSSLFNVWVGREVIQNTMTANITSCGWSGLYSAIDQANAVLKYAPDTAIPMTDAKRNWAMGQAYFARAYAYFWAARLWGDVPLNLRPIESVDQPETYPVRAPKADVYARIGSDIESAQINLKDKEQKKVFDHSTHFNPVDLVCGVKNYKGKKFDLEKFIAPEQGFITHKSYKGKEIKVQELPGLWNGAMANWITVFVEVPLTTFTPVKTVFDLFRFEHRNVLKK